MSAADLLLLVLGWMIGLSAVASILTRGFGRDTGFVLGAGYAAAAVAIGALAPRVMGGEDLVASIPWVPDLGIRLALRLDGLSLLFAILVLGVGALVMVYSARYLKAGDRHGRFYGVMTLFAASMLGLVLADDLIVLFVFWELTSITSFFLIGGAGAGSAKQAALRAFLVTALGGLALLGGLLLLSVVTGTFDLHETLGSAGAVRDHALAPAILVLLLVGAFTKSAMWPFHFWLPGAMIAPTPVSTYLHAATMVKAGIYLLARFSTMFAGDPAWTYSIVLVGLGTAVFAGVIALKQHDLKALLAYSTISQLALIIALIGVGTFASLAAAMLMTFAHAAFKGTLFMMTGVLEKATGSRDLRHLSGLRRSMPWAAAIAAAAAVSMAGLPPLLGFVGKEEALAAFLDMPAAGWLAGPAAALAVLASVTTVAYSARLYLGAFEGPTGIETRRPPASFLAAPAVTAATGVLLGLAVFALDPLISRAAASALGTPGRTDLSLWHGLTPALGLSALAIGLGAGLVIAGARVTRGLARVRAPIRGEPAFDRSYDGAIEAGRLVGLPFVSLSPARHIVWVFASAGAIGASAWFARGGPAPTPGPPAMPFDWMVAGVLILAVLAITRARNRLAAVAVLGATGFVIAVFYVLLGAPDLAITQLLIDTLTVAMVVLVFRRLPTTFRAVSRKRRLAGGAVAVLVGVLAVIATYNLTGHREISEAGAYFLEAAEEETGGRNIVNTILVDFRALDTLGEITVLAAAAVGVFVLVRVGRKPRDEEPV